MSPELFLAILQIGTPIAVEFAKLLAEGIHQLTLSIQKMNAPPTTVGVVTEIILGIDRTHPDWDGQKKKIWVRDAIAQFITNHGGDPDEKTINALIELSLQVQGICQKPQGD